MTESHKSLFIKLIKDSAQTQFDLTEQGWIQLLQHKTIGKYTKEQIDDEMEKDANFAKEVNLANSIYMLNKLINKWHSTAFDDTQPANKQNQAMKELFKAHSSFVTRNIKKEDIPHVIDPETIPKKEQEHKPQQVLIGFDLSSPAPKELPKARIITDADYEIVDEDG